MVLKLFAIDRIEKSTSQSNYIAKLAKYLDEDPQQRITTNDSNYQPRRHLRFKTPMGQEALGAYENTALLPGLGNSTRKRPDLYYTPL